MEKRKGVIKRSRTGCIQCRLAKKKCDELKPKCMACVTKDTECIWSDMPSQSLNDFLKKNGVKSVECFLARKGKRSRGGCLSCKKAKKKCDEIKPVCSRCLDHEIVCAWNHKGETDADMVKQLPENIDMIMHTNAELEALLQSTTKTITTTNNNNNNNNNNNVIMHTDAQLEALFLSPPNSPSASLSSSSSNNSLSFLNDMEIFNIQHLEPIEIDFEKNTIIEDYGKVNNIPSVNAPLDITTSFVTLLDFFFSNIIVSISPQQSVQILSEITLQSIHQCTSFRTIFSTFSASVAYNFDVEKQTYTDVIHRKAMSLIKAESNPEGIDLECKLHAVIFSMFRQVYKLTDNSELLEDIHEGIKILLLNRPTNPTKRFGILAETLLFNYAVSVIVTPQHILDKMDVSKICGHLRSFYPKVISRETNPLLGSYLDIVIILAKVSYFFRCKDLISNNSHSQLLLKINQILIYMTNVGIKDPLTNIFFYINVIAMKLLLLNSMSYQDETESERLKDDTLQKLMIARYRITQIEVYGIWGLFVFGLTLDDSRSQSIIVDYFRLCNEKRKSAKIEKLIDCLRYAWRHQAGLEILRDEEFISKVCLN